MSAALDVALAGLAGAYAWGWRSARRARPEAPSVWRLWAFLAGVIALWAAVASPLAQLDQGHLTGHMIQHLLIMTVAAPLLLLGEPARLFFPRWRPPLAARGWLSPHPLLCWFAGTLIVLVWHVPRVFELGTAFSTRPSARRGSCSGCP
jgi:putative membrane protein